ncbi:hypothetical protein EGM70_02610 [Enterobacteriaceae bacterium 89]|nr:hypothetical protein [Enterobacteriaceae bacterium 89]
MDSYNRVRTLVHSRNQLVRIALKNLCQQDINNSEVICTDNIDEFITCLTKYKPDYLVMDTPARECAYLIYDIREKYPTLPIVLVQKEFLFSDRVVAEYFGSVILKEYNALLSTWPSTLPSGLFRDESFCGPKFYFRASFKNNGKNISAEINRWMRTRLEGIVQSRRAREVSLNWLAKGIPPLRVSKKIDRSDKVVYFYRSIVMRDLNIEKTRDFVASLNVSR